MTTIYDFENYHKQGWYTFQDPLTNEVNVVPAIVIENWLNGSRPITEEHHPTIRAIILDWLILNSKE